MNDINPYSPPQETDSRIDPSLAVTAPAISLIVVSLIGLMSMLFTVGVNLIFLVGYTTGQFQTPPEIMAHMALRLVWGILMLASSVVILLGGINMLRLRKYDVCRLGAILAFIPCVGPCYLLGVPFGVWAIIVLNRPEVRDAFDKA